MKDITTILSKLGIEEASVSCGDFISAVESGSDVQLITQDADKRTLLGAAYLAAKGGPALLVCATEEKADALVAKTSAASDKFARATGEDASGVLAQGKILVMSAKEAGACCRSKCDLSSVSCCVADGIDSIVSEGGLSELEHCLLKLREASEGSQIVMTAAEASLHLSALSRRFLNTPKTVSLNQGGNVESEHWYYEVGNSLLAKPQALCDLLDLEEGKRALVFCNSPSDADFADVILKKRGIPSIKLIGYVPQIKLGRSIGAVQKDEVRVLVLTDVAARGVPLEEFDIVVNYSVPTDPELYFHRYSSGSGSRTTKVISLVSPLDIANFHYLKKLGKMELQKGELPSAESLMAGKFNGLVEQAVEKSLQSDATIGALVDKVLTSENVKEVIALLLHNTMVVMPSLRQPAVSEQSSDDYEETEEEDFEGGRGRGGRSDRGRGDRNDRGDRGGRGNRGGRRGSDRGDYEGNGNGIGNGRGYSDEDEGDSRQDNRRGRGRRNDRGDREEGDRDSGNERRGNRRPVVVDRDARLYVGQGSSQGMTAEKLTSTLVSQAQLSESDVKRIKVRTNYTFVDVPDELASQVVDALSDSSSDDSKPMLVKKAVTITVPRPGTESEEAPEGDDNNSGDQGSDEGDYNDSGSEGDSEGPTMLEVDDTI